MRIIDADVLRNLMYHEAFEVDSDMQKWDGGCWIRYKMFENCLAKTPTLVEERKTKTEKWIVDYNVWDAFVYKCTACGWGFEHVDGMIHVDDMKFCPHCGAKMSEVEK